MNYKFKSKGKYKYKTLKNIVFLTMVLVCIITFFLIYNFNKKINKTLINLSSSLVNKATYSFITDKINNSVLSSSTLEDVLIINQNSKEEILYVDFNLDKAYKLLDSVSNVLTDSFKNMENGNIDIAYYDKEISNKTNSMYLSIPLGNALDSMFFFNTGPKIPVKIDFIGTVLTNLETKITNYGLNNALVEVFIYIEFHNQIHTPFNYKDLTFKYDAVIASKMIQGSVPQFYNGSIEKQSSVYSKNID